MIRTMTKVNYLNFRTLSAIALALILTCTGGCVATQRAKVVSPVSGDVSGPRSFEALSNQVIAQSEELRLLAIRTRGLYRYYVNRYRVRIVVEEDGDVSEVELLERDFLLPEFEDRFLEIVSRFKFDEYEGQPVEFVYTFEFYPSAPEGALEHAAELDAAKQAETAREAAAEKAAAEAAQSEPLIRESVAPVDEPMEAAEPDEDMAGQAEATAHEAPMAESADQGTAGTDEASEGDKETAVEDSEEPMAADEPGDTEAGADDESAAEEPTEAEGSQIEEADLEEDSSAPKSQ